ncbi:hypothetical protein L596_028249 [Steinernema carpocapsae]|uniref:Uncharacterized protein n=1 Tax=Steinernema carpocapsae TaxID=34508 RepID=A0A4U5LXY1_STECR|nr:hypothetical protein L596_028249 [Steinernema carpocapsae]
MLSPNGPNKNREIHILQNGLGCFRRFRRFFVRSRRNRFHRGSAQRLGVLQEIRPPEAVRARKSIHSIAAGTSGSYCGFLRTGAETSERVCAGESEVLRRRFGDRKMDAGRRGRRVPRERVRDHAAEAGHRTLHGEGQIDAEAAGARLERRRPTRTRFLLLEDSRLPLRKISGQRSAGGRENPRPRQRSLAPRMATGPRRLLHDGQ